MAERAGLTRAMVSKLENGHNPNPTLDTLARYAQAMDMELKLSAEPILPDEMLSAPVHDRVAEE